MSTLAVRTARSRPAGGEKVVRRRRRDLVETALVIVAVAVGAALRVRTVPDLWVDEALSVNISKLRFEDLFEALRHDGHPPLYYLLLHGWMDVFGEGGLAVRSMSAVISVATLPLAWLAGATAGGRRCAAAAVVLFAVTPQAIHFGSEARMYSLVVFLVVGGWLVARALIERPTTLRVIGLALITAALLLTHYWAFYLVAAVATVFAWTAWWGPTDARRPARLALAAVGGGAILFLPWLPSFLAQLGATGTPWGPPARPTQVAAAMLTGGRAPSGEAQLLGLALGVLVLLALFGRTSGRSHFELDFRTRPGSRAEMAVIVLALAAAVVGGYVGAVAFASRYTAIVFPLVLLVAAIGVTRLPDRPVALVVLLGLLGLGGAAGLEDTFESRAQAPKVANAIEAGWEGGDLVVYCPDQLGPGVSRLLPFALRGVTFPELQRPERVEWVDYVERIGRTDPATFADEVLRRADGAPLWMVWQGGYRGLGRRCEAVVQALESSRPGPRIVLSPQDEGESSWLYRFAAR
ncbi:hypothetical protein BH18ACT1_BH18ACT1_04240 [soil metagenome]